MSEQTSESSSPSHVAFSIEVETFFVFLSSARANAVPQNEDHRCFMWCVLAPRGSRAQQAPAVKGHKLLGLLTQARQGPRPPGWQPALADVGDIDLRALQRWVVWQQTLWADGLEYYHVLQQRAPSGTGVVQSSEERQLIGI